MEAVCLASIWRESLLKQGWSERAATQMPFELASSTLGLYNRLLTKLKVFCDSYNCSFPPDKEADFVEFLCVIADSSDKPKSQLNCTMAAASKLYKALNLPNVTMMDTVKGFVTALVKSQTSQPRLRSSVMPVSAFTQLFSAWPDNEELAIGKLRMKALALLALTLMLRPSDVAPKAVKFDPVSHSATTIVFSVNHICFNDDGSLSATFFGIKNDTDQSGSEVKLPPTKVKRLDPVGTLRCYVERTAAIRSQSSDNAVFLPLQAPFHAIKASTISTILVDAIKEAGLEGQGYSAKSYRPTGATLAIGSGQSPEIVMKVGRWKTASVFYGHYVHTQTPATFTEAILQGE